MFKLGAPLLGKTEKAQPHDISCPDLTAGQEGCLNFVIIALEPLEWGGSWLQDVQLRLPPDLPDLLVLASFISLWSICVTRRALSHLLEPGLFLGS
jgi:hypothetical protein